MQRHTAPVAKDVPLHFLPGGGSFPPKWGEKNETMSCLPGGIKVSYGYAESVPRTPILSLDTASILQGSGALKRADLL